MVKINIIRIYKSKFKIILKKFDKFIPWNFYSKFSIHRYFYTDKNRYREFDINEKFLNLGAGSHFFHPRWECLDFYKNGMNKVHQNYINWDFREKKEFPKKYSLAYCSHVIEHIPKNEIYEFLLLVYNSLKKGSILRIIVPDSDLIYEAYKENRYDFFEIYESKINFQIPDNYKIELLFLNLIATKKSYKNTFNKDATKVSEIRKKFKELNKNQFLDYLVSDIDVNSTSGHEHVNWFNYEKLELILKAVGFKEVYRSAFGQSKSKPMREVPLFDGTLPCYSLYVEAKK